VGPRRAEDRDGTTCLRGEVCSNSWTILWWQEWHRSTASRRPCKRADAVTRNGGWSAWRRSPAPQRRPGRWPGWRTATDCSQRGTGPGTVQGGARPPRAFTPALRGRRAPDWRMARTCAAPGVGSRTRPLAAALDAFETLGAAPWAERARVELRACGQQRAADPSRLHELTPQEVQVARFVGRGLSTRESRHSCSSVRARSTSTSATCSASSVSAPQRAGEVTAGLAADRAGNPAFHRAPRVGLGLASRHRPNTPRDAGGAT
jgi:hypothetical protein